MWDDLEYERDDGFDHAPESMRGNERVLVAVITRPSDWELVRSQHWYRIPLARAPQRIAADYMAFYHTKAFDELRWTIRYYASIHSYRIVPRVVLLPNEPDHPRARALYYKVELGPLEMLPRPIPSEKLRRISFIPTTLSRLLSAREIRDLWLRTTARDLLWDALQTREIVAHRDYVIREGRLTYKADLAVPCVGKSLAVECVEMGIGNTPNQTAAQDLARGWFLERIAVAEVVSNPEGCADRIQAFVQASGGQPPDWEAP